MKKSIIIAIAALLSFGQGAWAQTPPTINGLTYENGYYKISCAKELNALATYVNADADHNCEGYTFKVTADITFGESDEFIPIGKVEYRNDTPIYDKAFKGTFDGDNKTIKGLKVNKTNIEGVGLFGVVSYPGVVKNVKISDSEFVGSLCVGAIAGEYTGNSDGPNEWGIYDCEVTSDVTVKAVSGEGDDALPAWYAGGIVGSANVATVKNCISAAKVSGEEYVGGVAGQILKSEAYFGQLIDCYYTGESSNVTATTNKFVNIIVGLNGEVNEDDEIEEGTAGTIAITLFADDSKDIKNAARMAAYSSLACNVTIKGLTLKKDGKWHALCLPFDLSALTGSPLAGAKVEKFETASILVDDLWIEFSQETSIAGGIPYLVAWDQGENITDPVFENVTFSNPSDSSEPGYVDFLGVKESPKSFTAGDRSVLLVNDNNKVYFPKEATTLNAFSAYFQLYDIQAGKVTEAGKVKECEVIDEESKDVLVDGTFVENLTLTDNADNSTAISNASNMICDVTLSGRTLYKDGGWNTLCLPFQVDDTDRFDELTFTGTPFEGAIVKTLSSSSFSDGTLTLNFEDAQTIEAGKPYIVKWNSGNHVDLSNSPFYGVAIVSETTNIPTDNIDFIGNFKPVALTKGDKSILYMGSGNQLYYPNAAFNINAFRGYFKLKGLTAGDLQASGTANAIVLNFGDETTSLSEEIRMKSEEFAAEWYSLDGRKLSGKPMAKGVYINNGKKIVIK